jgi:hypothetical protein
MHNFTSIILGGTAAITGAVTWRLTRWSGRIGDRERAYKQHKIYANYYEYRKPPKGSLYDYIEKLAINRIELNPENTAERAIRVTQLPRQELEEISTFALKWLDGAGRVAEEADKEDSHGLRTFMQTFHLSVIREASIVEPVYVAQTALATWPGELSNEQLKRINLGLALNDLAREYNSVAAQQRELVLFTQTDSMGRHFTLVERPPKWRIPLLNARDRMKRSFKLSEDIREKNLKRIAEATVATELRLTAP